jgi:hypothetical protein
MKKIQRTKQYSHSSTSFLGNCGYSSDKDRDDEAYDMQYDIINNR